MKKNKNLIYWAIGIIAAIILYRMWMKAQAKRNITAAAVNGGVTIAPELVAEDPTGSESNTDARIASTMGITRDVGDACKCPGDFGFYSGTTTRSGDCRCSGSSSGMI